MEAKTLTAFRKLIQSRGDLWEAANRNGYVLPKLTSSICTEEYLRKVISGEYYCPKDAEVRLKNCFAHPGKDYLQKKVLKAAKE